MLRKQKKKKTWPSSGNTKRSHIMKHFNKKGQEFTSSITKKREENTMDEYQSIGCMTSIWERAISILAGNLNLGCSFLITAVRVVLNGLLGRVQPSRKDSDQRKCRRWWANCRICLQIHLQRTRSSKLFSPGVDMTVINNKSYNNKNHNGLKSILREYFLCLQCIVLWCYFTKVFYT